MQVLWARQASEDFDYWQTTDLTVASKIRQLISNIQETPFQGIGKPEPLKGALAGYWSRRITLEHRLVYKVEGNPSVLTTRSAGITTNRAICTISSAVSVLSGHCRLVVRPGSYLFHAKRRCSRSECRLHLANG